MSSVAFSPDGKILASGSWDNTVKLWEYASGRELRTFSDHEDIVWSVAFSPDGKSLASGSKDMSVKVRDLASGNLIANLTGHTLDVWCVAFSPDGQTLASGSFDKSIRLWDITTGRELRELSGHTNVVRALAFSPDGKTLVSGSQDRSIKTWDVESGRELRSFSGHTDHVWSIAVSPDGRTIASASYDTTIKLWDLRSGVELFTFYGHFDWVTSVAFSPKGNILASGSHDKTVKLWDLSSGEVMMTFTGHSDGINAVSFSPDRKTLVSGSEDQTIRSWDIESRKQVGNLYGLVAGARPIDISPDGRTLVSEHECLVTNPCLGLYKVVKLWHLESGKEMWTLPGHSGGVWSTAFSRDGRMLASSGEKENSIRLWDVESGTELRTLEGNTDCCHSLSFSPDGRRLASKNSEGTFKLWNVDTGVELITFQSSPADGRNILTFGNGGPFWTLFSKDGKTLAVEGPNFTVRLLDVESGQEKAELSGHTAVVSAAVLSPDENLLATGDRRGVVKFWDLRTGEELYSLSGHTSPVYSLVISPDGKTLASGSADETVRLWDVANGRELRTLLGHTGQIGWQAFSEDGKVLASGDGMLYRDAMTVKLWDVDSGRELASMPAGDTATTERLLSAVPSYFSAPNRMSTDGHLQRIITNGRFQFKEGANGKLDIYHVISGKLLVSLIALDEEGWVAVTPEGRFDSNKLEDPKGLHWISPDAPFEPLSFEIFVREYFEPKLLTRLLKCTEEGDCDREFKPVRDLSALNRAQPKLRIRSVRSTTKPELADVLVEVENVESGYQKDKSGKALSSGVYDLRLFRDGQLVRYSTSDEDVKSTLRSFTNLDEELKAWRDANKIELNKEGKAVLTFKDVRLPRDGKGKVEFSAYAFNSDRVKSNTARTEYSYEPKETRLGNTYLVSVGVNSYENKRYDLSYAANDARRMQEVLGERLKVKLKATNQKLYQIPIVSDKADGARPAVNNATKEVIKGVFSLLSGKAVSPEILEKIPVKENGKDINSKELPRIEPEDKLIISVSSHGYAAKSGIFYILPNDIGENTTGITDDVLPKLISSDELSLWMRDITAKEMLMIVDACHS
ncbi:MAG: caspase family protein, partial [Acidobacteriota bacterium]|nr:caspase family protein [Acidobacteriota bacterium]